MEIYMFHHLIIMAIIRFVDIFKVDVPIWLKVGLVYILTICVAYVYNKMINPLINMMQQKVLILLK